MASTTYPADIRQQVAEFAATHPTPSVRRAIQLAEVGALTWQQVYDLFKRALARGVEAVAQPSPPRSGLVQCPNGCGHWVVEGAYIDPTLPCP